MAAHPRWRRPVASRRSQPYRKGAATRAPGGALTAMTRGRDAQGNNPQDVRRRTHKMARRKRGGIHIKPGNRGKLRAQLGAKKGTKLSLSALLAAKNSSDPATRRRANFAINARKWRHR